MRYFSLVLVLTAVAGCGTTPWGVRLSDHKEEIIERAVEAAERVANNPGAGNVASELGGLLTYVALIALGGKTYLDRQRFKKIENGGAGK